MNGMLSSELFSGIVLRDLLKLVLLCAYAVCLLFGVKKGSKRQTRIVIILCAACAVMGAMHTLARLTAPGGGLNRRLDYPCAALLGFWAGAYIGAGRKTERYAKFARRRLTAHLLFGMFYILLCDIQGKTGNGIFSRTDGMGLSRYMPALSAGITLALLVITIEVLKAVLSERFTPKPVCCFGMFLGVFLPFYALADSFQARVFGVSLDALAGWLCMVFLLLVYIRIKLRESELPLRLKAAAALLSLVPAVIMLLTLAIGNFWLALLMGALCQAAVMSPLFPFFRRPVRVNNRSKRKYS